MMKFTLTPPWSSPLWWCGCFCGRGHQRRCRGQGQQCSTAWQWHQRRRRTPPLTWSPTVGTHQFSWQSCHTLGTWCTHSPDWNIQQHITETCQFFGTVQHTLSPDTERHTISQTHAGLLGTVLHTLFPVWHADHPNWHTHCMTDTCQFVLLLGMHTFQTEAHNTPKTHVSLLDCLVCTLSRLKHTSWLAARQITTHNATSKCFVL